MRSASDLRAAGTRGFSWRPGCHVCVLCVMYVCVLCVMYVTYPLNPLRSALLYEACVRRDALTLTYGLTSPCPASRAAGSSSVTAVEPAAPDGFDWETKRAGAFESNRGRAGPNRDSRVNILPAREG